MEQTAKRSEDTDTDVQLAHSYFYLDCQFGDETTPNGIVALAQMNEAQTARAVKKILTDLAHDPAMLQYVITNFVLTLQDTEKYNSRDRLTGLYTRAPFEEMMAYHLDRVSRALTDPGVIVYIDLDKFKPINDTYGHSAGDMALKTAADTIRKNIRSIDIAGRLGGDEFAVLLPDNEKDSTIHLVERLRDVFSSLNFCWEGNTIDIRASIGMARIQAGQSIEEVFSAADAAMYEIKKGKPALHVVSRNNQRAPAPNIPI